MPDTALLHLITDHTVRTTSTVQAVLDAAQGRLRCLTTDWPGSKTRTVTSCTSGLST